MERQPLVSFPQDRARALNVVGEQITVLASGAATGGWEVFVHEGPEGSGPPPHSHPWDEAFYVVEGEVQFGFGPDTMTARAGTFVHLPAGAPHWFRLSTGGGKMLSMSSRLGASRMFTQIDKEVPPGPPDIATLVSIAAQHDVRFEGPPPAA